MPKPRKPPPNNEHKYALSLILAAHTPPSMYLPLDIYLTESGFASMSKADALPMPLKVYLLKGFGMSAFGIAQTLGISVSSAYNYSRKDRAYIDGEIDLSLLDVRESQTSEHADVLLQEKSE